MSPPEPEPLLGADGLPFLRRDTPIAFDFDGVLAAAAGWPDNRIGEPIEKGIALFNHYLEQGYKPFVFTSRPWHDKPAIERFCWEHIGVRVEVVCGKPLATMYIDDRAVRFEENGLTAEEQQAFDALSSLLIGPIRDGGQKRRSGAKPNHWTDEPDHMLRLDNHRRRYDAGELVDPDSGRHPLVHVGTRSLMQAWKEGAR